MAADWGFRCEETRFFTLTGQTLAGINGKDCNPKLEGESRWRQLQVSWKVDGDRRAGNEPEEKINDPDFNQR